nr:hypothetical protein BaRGS_014869 [Batillaria attramentaria]
MQLWMDVGLQPGRLRTGPQDGWTTQDGREATSEGRPGARGIPEVNRAAGQHPEKDCTAGQRQEAGNSVGDDKIGHADGHHPDVGLQPGRLRTGPQDGWTTQDGREATSEGTWDCSLGDDWTEGLKDGLGHTTGVPLDTGHTAGVPPDISCAAGEDWTLAMPLDYSWCCWRTG